MEVWIAPTFRCHLARSRVLGPWRIRHLGFRPACSRINNFIALGSCLHHDDGSISHVYPNYHKTSLWCHKMVANVGNSVIYSSKSILTSAKSD
ncbi:hypothetical protein JTE90_005055 [Oedothorax gibbosus]|uniref:Uncharacterized protein n=1 Tax=Oedothorax gibbosus TaxID=931172 RepID=A0AAV6VAY1_9ARAC|nr:hypothetical protein JTE90_005055 [Oedothorax gibbosus]